MWSKIKSRIWASKHDVLVGESPIVSEAKINKAINKIDATMDESEKQKLVFSRFVPKVSRVASYIPFARDLVAAYYCMLDQNTPLKIRSLILLPLVYFVVPTDAVPDFIPVLGLSDDGAVFTGALALFASYLNEEHYAKASSIIAANKSDESPHGTL